MLLNTIFLGELKHESGNTQKILERTPMQQFAWKPHEKSMSLGRLATHIADLPLWISLVVDLPEFDFINGFGTKQPVENNEALLAIFQETKAAAIRSLENTNDEHLNETWALKRNGNVLYEMPRKLFIRNLALNHVVHHRGQLSVYLRLLNIPVPGIYGPSADDI